MKNIIITFMLAYLFFNWKLFKASETYISLVFSSLILLFFGFLTPSILEAFLLLVILSLFLFFLLVFIKFLLIHFNLWNHIIWFYGLSLLYLLLLPFSLLLFSFFSFFILPWFLQIIIFRLSFGIILAFSSIFLIFFIYLTSNKEQSFSDFYKRFLPLIFFFILLSSIFYLASLVNLDFFLSVFFIYNLRSIAKFYKESWTPIILKSSLIWNIFRFCTPAPFFLFGFEDFILSGWILIFKNEASTLMSAAKYHNLLKVSQESGFSRQYSQIVNKPSILNDFVQNHLKNSMDYLANPFPEAYKRFLDLSKDIGLIHLDSLKPFTTATSKQLNSSRFLTENPREFLPFLAFLVDKPEKLVIHSSLIFPSENLMVISPEATVTFSDIKGILTRFANVNQSFIFYLEGVWYFSPEDIPTLEGLVRIKDENLTNCLNNISSDCWKDRTPFGVKGALLPVNDLLVVSPDLSDFKMVQSKFLYSNLFPWELAPEDTINYRVTNADFMVYTKPKESTIFVFQGDTSKEVQKLLISSIKVLSPEQATLLENSMLKGETFIENFSNVKQCRVKMLPELIKRGALFEKQKILVKDYKELIKFKDDV